MFSKPFLRTCALMLCLLSLGISTSALEVDCDSTYCFSVEDFAGATEIYRKLCEEPVLEAGFLGNIRAAGLAGPFDENFYLELKKIIDGRA